MRNQKVLQHNQIDWYEEESTRLNFQMIFNEAEEKAAEEIDGPQANVEEVIRRRDAKWQKKLEQSTADAHKAGFEEGLQAGLEQARQEIDAKLKHVAQTLEAGHQQWQKNQELLEPGILDMAFEIAESILGIPVENPAIRTTLENELAPLLNKINAEVRPVLWVAESDLEVAEAMREELSEHTPFQLMSCAECKPGEFKLETDEETITHNLKEMLHDFRENLSLPSWK